MSINAEPVEELKRTTSFRNRIPSGCRSVPGAVHSDSFNSQKPRETGPQCDTDECLLRERRRLQHKDNLGIYSSGALVSLQCVTDAYNRAQSGRS